MFCYLAILARRLQTDNLVLASAIDSRFSIPTQMDNLRSGKVALQTGIFAMRFPVGCAFCLIFSNPTLLTIRQKQLVRAPTFAP